MIRPSALLPLQIAPPPFCSFPKGCPLVHLSFLGIHREACICGLLYFISCGKPSTFLNAVSSLFLGLPGEVCAAAPPPGSPALGLTELSPRDPPSTSQVVCFVHVAARHSHWVCSFPLIVPFPGGVGLTNPPCAPTVSCSLESLSSLPFSSRNTRAQPGQPGPGASFTVPLGSCPAASFLHGPGYLGRALIEVSEHLRGFCKA